MPVLSFPSYISVALALSLSLPLPSQKREDNNNNDINTKHQSSTTLHNGQPRRGARAVSESAGSAVSSTGTIGNGGDCGRSRNRKSTASASGKMMINS